LSPILIDFLKYPELRHLELDDPETTIARKSILQKNRFLWNIYFDWYQSIKKEIPENAENIIEIGSGAGFSEEMIPAIIKSDILFLPFSDLTINAHHLPVTNKIFDAVIMINVFHHLPHPYRFMYEINRTLREGGKLVMIEPWITSWSKWVLPRLHHEPFQMEGDLESPREHQPLSGANQAIPWIVFERDKDYFLGEFPNLKLQKLDLLMPFRYLFSGGFSFRLHAPGWSYKYAKFLDSVMEKRIKKWAMFALLVVEKVR